LASNGRPTAQLVFVCHLGNQSRIKLWLRSSESAISLSSVGICVYDVARQIGHQASGK
jgi:hypothetical protein